MVLNIYFKTYIMKNILTLVITLFVGVIAAQNSRVVNGGTLGSDELFNAANSSLSSYGVSATFYNPKKQVEGSVHLFNNWNNFAVIFTSDNQKFALKNINLNIERNTFESKIPGDSIFTFNVNNIAKFVINNKVFKNLYYNNENRIFEMIYESDKFLIIKGYRIELVAGSVNPMVNRKNDKYVQKSSFYLKQGEIIKPFKLSKKRILKLIGDQERVAKMEKYVLDNNLSYKKEDDVKRVLEYISEN